MTGFEEWLESIERTSSPASKQTRLWRLSPTVPLTMRIAAARARSRRRFETHADAREHALSWTAIHSDGSSDEGLARAALTEEAALRLLESTGRSRHAATVVGPSELKRARDTGRGAVIASLHLGPAVLIPEVLALRIGRVYVIGAEEWTDRRRAESRGVRFIDDPANEGAAAELLRRGMVVFTFFDAKGTTATSLLDQSFSLSSLVSELAYAADAPVFPALAVRRGPRLHVELLPRLEPRLDWTPEDLHQRIADVLDPALRANLPQLYPAVLPA